MSWRWLRIYPNLFDYIYPRESVFLHSKMRRLVGRWFWRTIVLQGLTFIGLFYASSHPLAWLPLLGITSVSFTYFIRVSLRAMRHMR